MKLWPKKKSSVARPGTAGKPRLGSRERRLLTETALIEEETLPMFVRPMLLITLATTLVFMVWAGTTRIKEVAVAPGEIIPLSKVKVVQHIDGGIVAEIHVDERMKVSEGQVLLELDGSQAIAELRQRESRKVALQLRAERLAAFAERRKPEWPVVDEVHKDLLADQMDVHRMQVAAMNSTLSVLGRQIEQRKNRIGQLEQSLVTAEKHQRLTEEMTGMREDLAAKRLVNRTILLETRRAHVTAAGEVDRIREDVARSRQELAETQSRQVDTLNQLQRDALNEMGAVRAEMAEVEESLQRLKTRVERLIVRAPHAGLIQDLKVQTVGQVVLPGAVLMQVVPDDATLEAEVRIGSRDAGHVRAGQDVNLRISSYEYTRYGYVPGILKRVSATSIVDPQTNNVYYRGWVTLTQSYAGTEPGRYLVQPGMSLEADIVTGEKSLLAYLFKPLADTLARSFRER